MLCAWRIILLARKSMNVVKPEVFSFFLNELDVDHNVFKRGFMYRYGCILQVISYRLNNIEVEINK